MTEQCCRLSTELTVAKLIKNVQVCNKDVSKMQPGCTTFKALNVLARPLPWFGTHLPGTVEVVGNCHPVSRSDGLDLMLTVTVHGSPRNLAIAAASLAAAASSAASHQPVTAAAAPVVCHRRAEVRASDDELTTAELCGEAEDE